MTRIVLDDLEFPADVVEKLERKHGVQPIEVEAACFSSVRQFRRGRRSALLVLSQTDAGRYLFVVLAATDVSGLWRVITARDMTFAERRYFRRRRR
jgi:hypothetical protein